jgi:hypothetical protein
LITRLYIHVQFRKAIILGEQQQRNNKASQNTLALPIDKMLYIYLLSTPKTIPSNLNNPNTFTKETISFNVKLGSNKVKLPKGSWIQCHDSPWAQQTTEELLWCSFH